MQFHRNARVDGPDGELGRVRHVIVDHETREVTDIVVANDLQEWTIPLAEVQSVDGDHVLLKHPTHAIINSMPPFDRDSYHAVDEEAAREESTRTARHGGEPLRDAGDGSVATGSAQPVEGAQFHRGPDADSSRPFELQLRSERLRVDKEAEQAGRVRLRKEVVERLETVQVPVREERLVIEALPGSGRVLIGERELAAGESIELTLARERVVVDKQTVVQEDVLVRKELVTRTENVEETLRSEQLAVDDPDSLVSGGAQALRPGGELDAPAAGTGQLPRSGPVADYHPDSPRPDSGIAAQRPPLTPAAGGEPLQERTGTAP